MNNAYATPAPQHEAGMYLFYFIKKAKGNESGGMVIEDNWTCVLFAPTRAIAIEIMEAEAKRFGVYDQVKAHPTNMISHFFCMDWLDKEMIRLEDLFDALKPPPKVEPAQMVMATQSAHVLHVVKNALMKKIIETKDTTLLFQNRAQFTEAELLYIDEKMK